MTRNQKTGILHLITGLGFGGAERVVYDLVRLGSRDEFDFHVIGLTNDIDRIEEFRAISIEPVIASLNKNKLTKIFSFLFELKRYIQQHQISIIHAHMFHGGLIAQMLKLIMPSIPIVFTSHSVTLGSNFRNKLFQITKKLRKVDIIFSELMKANFYTQNISIIPNGVEVITVPTVEKNSKFTYISIAGLRPVKNHIHLIDCAAEMRKKGIEDFEIWIVGKGETESLLTTAIAKHHLQNHVILKGFQKEVIAYAAKAHVFVMPSLWEGFPISILEAGLAEIPVLATPVGSIPDMLSEECGYLAEQKNFMSSMVEIKDNYADAILRGKKFRQKVLKQYDINIIIQQHENLYKSLAHIT